ncbi:MAG: transglycosylase SLT domain-containing protein, partial [Patescibacteria group bacterium]|nr:transglycosylase SLT domain-containing protein [Patescibacteria group bacterium]
MALSIGTSGSIPTLVPDDQVAADEQAQLQRHFASFPPLGADLLQQAKQTLSSVLNKPPNGAQNDASVSNASSSPEASQNAPSAPAVATRQPQSQPSAQPTQSNDLVSYARQMAAKYGIDADVFVKQINQESGFSPTAHNPSGATGIAQFMPGTAQGYGVDPTNPYQSLDGAARMMADLLKANGGDYARALAAYNAGQGNVDKYGGVPPFQETQTYVRNILGGTVPQGLSAPYNGPSGSTQVGAPATPGTPPNGGNGKQPQFDLAGAFSSFMSSLGAGADEIKNAVSGVANQAGQDVSQLGQDVTSLGGQAQQTAQPLIDQAGNVANQAEQFLSEPAPPMPTADMTPAQRDANRQQWLDFTNNHFGGAVGATAGLEDAAGNVANDVGNAAGSGVDELLTRFAQRRQALQDAKAASDAAVRAAAPSAPEGWTRYFHGTDAAFTSPDASNFDQNAPFFGPGYYMSSDPVTANTWATKSPGGVGGNVRQIDVPNDINLLDAGRKVPPDAVQRVFDVAKAANATSGQLKDFVDYWNHLNSREGGVTGSDLRTMLWSIAKGKQDTINLLLSKAGYDGMSDVDGVKGSDPLNNGQIAIFPQSLNKIKNALSGIPGGAFVPGAMAGMVANQVSGQNQQPSFDLQGAFTNFMSGLGATKDEIAQAIGSTAQQAANAEMNARNRIEQLGGVAGTAVNDRWAQWNRTESNALQSVGIPVSPEPPSPFEPGILPEEAAARMGPWQDWQRQAMQAMVMGTAGGAPEDVGGAVAGKVAQEAALPLAHATEGLVSSNPANQKLLDMFAHAPVTEEASTIGQRLATARDNFVRAWTDNRVTLGQIQKATEKAIGRPLNANEMATELSRLNPDPAAAVNLQQNLRPALLQVGKDQPWLSVYLSHMDNIDVAKSTASKVQQAALDREIGRVAGTSDLRAANGRLAMAQRQLDLADPNDTALQEQLQAKLAKAQKQAQSAQSRVDAATAAAQAKRVASASQKGAAAAANRAFSGGMSVADSVQALQDMANELGPERMQNIQDAAQKVWNFGHDLLQRKVDAGLITQELADHLQSEFPHYSPTRITDYLTHPDSIPRGQTLSVRTTGLKKLTIEGTTKAREDPLASMVRNAYQTEALARKNETFNAFVNLVNQNPDVQSIIRPVTSDFRPTVNDVKVTGFINGEHVYYGMPRDLAELIQNQPRTAIPVLDQAMGVLRGLMASRNPLFIPTHAMITAIPYVLRTTTREAGDGTLAAATAPRVLPRVIGALGSAYVDAFKGLATGDFGPDTARYLSGGGGMFGTFESSPVGARLAVQDLARPNAFVVKNAADLRRVVGDVLTGRPVESIINRVDMAPRVAAMKLAEARGANAVQAVNEGRNVSIDFAQGGNWAKAANSFIPFFNVALQGAAQPARMIRDNPKAALSTLVSLLAGPTVAAEAWNNSD